MRYILIATMFFFLSRENYGQIYLNDPNWTLKLNDDFSGPTLNSTYWYDRYIWGNVNNGDEYNDPSNLSFTSSSGKTYLTIKCDTLKPPKPWPRPSYPLDSLHYRSGAIYSKTTYKYGYWEISAKFPADNQGYWPAFWLWENPGNIPGCPADSNNIINEIDIMENGGFDSKFNNRMGINYHWRDINCIEGSLSTNLLSATQIIPGNITNEHKYGMFWEPGKMTWYFDDVPVKIVEDPSNTPTHALATIINFAISPPVPRDWGALSPGTVFPAYLNINYINIYQLNPSPSNCNTAENICTFNTGTYIYQVKKSISIGGAGCTSSINTTDNVNLWSTDFVQLNEGTTVTSGGSGNFSANITNCPN